MAEKVYVSYFGKPTEAWYQLSAEEQESLNSKVFEALEAAGGKIVLFCDCSWTSAQWSWFGVNEYPNIEALQKHTALQAEHDWSRYHESVMVVGNDALPEVG